MDLRAVRKIALALPEVEDASAYGSPAFKVRGKVMAWFPKKKEVEPGSLGVRMSILEREHRMAAAPDVYYVTPHYLDYPSVLARPERLTDAALRELLESGHEFMLAQSKRRPPKRRR